MDDALTAPSAGGIERNSLVWAFAVTIFASAFLLFQVQPLIGKFILPWFGGSPSVWTTCLVFFQVTLFLGYVYAHVLTRYVPPRAQAWVHAALLLLAVVLLRVEPASELKPTSADAPVTRILWLLSTSVGLPYFALSATGPLLQAWFSRAFPARSPYRLYALSNVGSLLALLSFPFVFEPALSAERQAWAWSWGFAGFALLCAGTALVALRGQQDELAYAKLGEASAVARPSWRQRAVWPGLSACASLMLLAATNHVCADVAVVPFLWVIPLAIYLISFIVSFDHPAWYARRSFALLTFFAVLAVGCIDPLEDALDAIGVTIGFVPELILYFVALFSLCMTCHGELARSRPAPAHLTEFYLLIAAGGALGGAFVSLVCPLVFSTFREWTLGLCAALALAVAVLFASSGALRSRRWFRLAVVAPVPLLWLSIFQAQSDSDEPLELARNFYGVISVYEVDRDDRAAHRFSLAHGIVVHGRQFAAAERRRVPVAYYSHESGVGRALTELARKGPLNIGAVGLGVGTLAAYARPGDRLRFYEINPEILRFAKQYFTYLADSPAPIETVIGDARLSLEREPAQNFDLLVLDAFSGDAVPAHLLTREAFAVYLRQLAANGVLAVNVTNRHLDLPRVVDGVARHYQLATRRIYTESDAASLSYRADWMLLARDGVSLASLPDSPPRGAEPPGAPRLWTDHSSDMLSILH